MQKTKNEFEKLITSYFTTEVKSIQDSNKDYFYINISPDNNDSFLIKTAIPIKAVENYSKATGAQKDNFNAKLEKLIKSNIKNFSGNTESWPVNFDITY